MSLPLERQNMKWISVKDRLPISETDEFAHYESFDVIVCDGSGAYPAIAAAGRYPVFWFEFHQEGFDGKRTGITHWMPMPDPPVLSNKSVESDKAHTGLVLSERWT